MRLLLRSLPGCLGPAALAVAAPAAADHPGPLREATMSPLVVGLLSAGLALAAALLVLVIVRLLARREPSGE
jgi:hypothetical protein